MPPGLNGVLRMMRPPAPRPLGAPPLNSHSTPKSSSSVSVTEAIVTSMATCRGRHVELLERRLDDLVLGRRRDDQQRVVVLVGHDLDVADDADALGGARDAPARPDAGGGGVLTLIVEAADSAVVFCAWNVGGETIVPAGVPGATVGGGVDAAAAARPVNACVQQRRQFLGALVLQVVDVEARAVAAAAWSSRAIHFFASSRYAGCGVMTRSAFIRSIGMMRRMPVSGLVLRSPTTLSSSCPTAFTSEFCSVKTPDRHAGDPVDVEDDRSSRAGAAARARCRTGSAGCEGRRGAPRWHPSRTARGCASSRALPM
mgnify:CR=1 FL=1